jgi:hypothetical protein
VNLGITGSTEVTVEINLQFARTAGTITPKLSQAKAVSADTTCARLSLSGEDYLAELRFHWAFPYVYHCIEGCLATRAVRISFGSGAVVPEHESSVLALGPRYDMGAAEAGSLLPDGREMLLQRFRRGIHLAGLYLVAGNHTVHVIHSSR